MRINFRYQSSALIVLALLFSTLSIAAPISKTVTIPSASTLFSTGSPVLSTGVLSVGMSGVEYIPSAASESRALASISKGLAVPTTGIVSALKSGLKANLGSLALTATVSAAIAGVDWLMTDGVLTKKVQGASTVVPTNYSLGQYSWYYIGTPKIYASSAVAACPATLNYNSSNPAAALIGVEGLVESSASCVYKICVNTSCSASTTFTIQGVARVGTSCPSGSTYSITTGGCVTTAVSYSPVSDSDYSVLDGFVQGKDGVWQQSLVNDICAGSTNFDSCVGSMGATPQLSGPSTVSSTPVTTTSTTKNVDGTSTTTATTTKTDYKLGYPAGTSSIDITPTTTAATTTTQQDATGATTSTGTSTNSTTTSSDAGTAVADGTFTDTPFPAVSPFLHSKIS